MPQEFTKLDRAKGEVSHRWPQLLPGGDLLLFTVWTGPGAEGKHLALLRLSTGERHVLVEGASTGRYVPTGHIVYSRGEALMAVPFDRARLAVTGAPVALEAYVRERTEGALYTFSDSGLLNLAALFAGNHLPTIGINVTDTVASPDGGVLIPPRSVFVHPGPNRQAIVAWQSPVHGFVRVTGRVSDLDPSCDNGVIWSVNQGATTIAWGVIENGGRPQSFQFRRVFVDEGDVLYFIVDAGMEDYACDTTGLDVRIWR
jgi:hypothetical protein